MYCSTRDTFLRNFYIMPLIANHAKMKCPTWNVIFGTLLAHMPRQLQEQLNFANIKLFALQSGTMAGMSKNCLQINRPFYCILFINKIWFNSWNHLPQKKFHAEFLSKSIDKFWPDKPNGSYIISGFEFIQISAVIFWLKFCSQKEPASFSIYYPRIEMVKSSDLIKGTLKLY